MGGEFSSHLTAVFVGPRLAHAICLHFLPGCSGFVLIDDLCVFFGSILARLEVAVLD